jgi:hypothetical protein
LSFDFLLFFFHYDVPLFTPYALKNSTTFKDFEINNLDDAIRSMQKVLNTNMIKVNEISQAYTAEKLNVEVAITKEKIAIDTLNDCLDLCWEIRENVPEESLRDYEIFFYILW